VVQDPEGRLLRSYNKRDKTKIVEMMRFPEKRQSGVLIAILIMHAEIGCRA
jgi:hypothetical protein